MKIKDIKTREQFYEFAYIWYQRTHNLREIWQNPEETDYRKQKAARLWEIMKNRVLELSRIATKFNQVKTEFKKGGTNESKRTN